MRAFEGQNGNREQSTYHQLSYLRGRTESISNLTARVQDSRTERHLLLFVEQTEQKDGTREELSSALSASLDVRQLR